MQTVTGTSDTVPALQDDDSPRIYDFSEIGPTFAEAAWAAAHLADLPVVVSLSRNEVEEWSDPDGRRWREAGVIVASPFTAKRFRIHLYRGASHVELERLKRVVEDARRGIFTRAGWDEERNQLGTRFVYRLSHLAPTRSYMDHAIECDEINCEDEYHFVEDGFVPHFAASLVGPGYTITVSRMAPNDAQWSASVCCEDDLTPDDIDRFIADLQQARQKVSSLNSPSVGGGQIAAAA